MDYIRHYLILQLIHAHPTVSLSRLWELFQTCFPTLGVKRNSFYKIISRMEDSGLILAETNSDTPPQKFVALSPVGVEEVQKIAQGLAPLIAPPPKPSSQPASASFSLAEISPEEVAEAAEALIWSLAPVIGKEPEEFSEAESKKWQLFAAKLVRGVAKSLGLEIP